MLKYLLGTENGIQGKDLGKQGGVKPEEVEWKTTVSTASWIWW